MSLQTAVSGTANTYEVPDPPADHIYMNTSELTLNTGHHGMANDLENNYEDFETLESDINNGYEEYAVYE